VINSNDFRFCLNFNKFVGLLLLDDSLLDLEHVILSLILHSFLVKFHAHFLVSDSFNVISFSLFLLDFQLLFVILSFLSLNSKSLFGFENLSFGTSFSVHCVELIISF